MLIVGFDGVFVTGDEASDRPNTSTNKIQPLSVHFRSSVRQKLRTICQQTPTPIPCNLLCCLSLASLGSICQLFLTHANPPAAPPSPTHVLPLPLFILTHTRERTEMENERREKRGGGGRPKATGRRRRAPPRPRLTGDGGEGPLSHHHQPQAMERATS